MTIALAVVLQLAAACAPNVAPETIAAIAYTESRFDPLVINDNSSGRSYSPGSLIPAIALASRLRAQGHSIDLGLMQVNSANLGRLGLSLADSFDPCKSVAAGARVLAAAFTGGDTPPAEQRALLVALSRYNTGDPVRGFRNGYVQRVKASAEQLIPALAVTPLPPFPAGHGHTQPAAAAPVAAEGEWHAISVHDGITTATTNEWHAGESSPRERRQPTVGGTATPAPVLLEDQKGSKP